MIITFKQHFIFAHLTLNSIIKILNKFKLFLNSQTINKSFILLIKRILIKTYCLIKQKR